MFPCLTTVVAVVGVALPSSVCSSGIVVHMRFVFLFWMDHVIGGQGSDRLHGSIDKMIGEWENDGVDMIQAHDISDKVGANVDDARRAHGRARDRELMATNDGPSAEE